MPWQSLNELVGQKQGFQELKDQLGYFQIDILDIRNDVERLLSNEDSEYTQQPFFSNDMSSSIRVIGKKRRKALIWLSDIDFEDPHGRARKLRFNDTGKWLFGKPEFLSWSETEASLILWLNGKGTVTETLYHPEEKLRFMCSI